MTHAVQVELICDFCEARFPGRIENIPNTTGRTKGTPMEPVREEAKGCGWRRIRVPRSESRRAVTVDCCRRCFGTIGMKPEALAKRKFWFEE